MQTYFLSIAALNIILAIRQLIRIGIPYRHFFFSLSITNIVLAIIFETATGLLLINIVPTIFLFLIQATLIALTTDWVMTKLLTIRLRYVVGRLRKRYGFKVKAQLTDEFVENAMATYDQKGHPLVLFSVIFANFPRPLLTFLVGHELAHIGLGHVKAEAISRESEEDLGWFGAAVNLATLFVMGVIPGGPILGIAAAAIAQKAFLNWTTSQNNYAQELQADAAGVIAAIENGYDEKPVVKVFTGLASEEPKRSRIMRAIHKVTKVETHPEHVDRAKHAQEVAEYYRSHGFDATWERYVQQ